jgi:hypothetical protein
MRNVTIALILAAAPFSASPALAQTPPIKADDPVEAQLHTDWAQLKRYQDANARLKPSPGYPRAVFIGDSITDWWGSGDPSFWTNGHIDRGIGGQTTPQMVVRFRQDVIDLHPDVVHIIGGTNDIGGNTGPMTPEQTEANIQDHGRAGRGARHSSHHRLDSPSRSLPLEAERGNWRADHCPQRLAQGLCGAGGRGLR